MKYVVIAWIGEPLNGHGTAVCGACGWWTTRSQAYGTVALAALAHDQSERQKAPAQPEG